MKHSVLKALVVGLGQIGMGYDYNNLSPDYVLTHARAFAQHPRFKLMGGVHSRSSQCDLFTEAYSLPAFTDLSTALLETEPDVIAIAVPTEQHGEVIRTILQRGKPTTILCEKPLSYQLEEARQMIDQCAKQACPLYVNYMRRSDPAVIEIKRRLNQQEIKGPIKGVVWYSKGLFHNGSHFFNLLQYWLGDMQEFQVISAGRLWNNLDPEPDLQVKFAGGEIFFLSAFEENFSHYTTELLTANGRLRYERGGEKLLWQKAEADPLIQGYKKLSVADESIETGMQRSQWHVADQLALSLEDRPAHICTGIDALSTLTSLAAIRSKL